MYTAQRDINGNTIVCKGSVVRNGTYRIIFTGSYADCMLFKD